MRTIFRRELEGFGWISIEMRNENLYLVRDGEIVWRANDDQPDKAESSPMEAPVDAPTNAHLNIALRALGQIHEDANLAKAVLMVKSGAAQLLTPAATAYETQLLNKIIAAVDRVYNETNYIPF